MGHEGDVDSPRDEAWFDAMFRGHHRALLSYGRRRVDDADALVAEVFTQAWRHRDRVPDEPLPWLYRTATNLVMHDLRTQARTARLQSRIATRTEHLVHADHAGDVSGDVDAQRLVGAVLTRMRPSDREVLRLAIWEQLDSAEIAYVLNCSTPAARVRLHRARQRFADLLGTSHEGADDDGHDQDRSDQEAEVTP